MEDVNKKKVIFKLEPVYYIYNDENNICHLGLEPNGILHDKWVLGIPFLRSYYSVFDIENQRIGLTQASPKIIL